MRQIYFLAYKGTDIIAKVIKRQTQSEYSHIAYLPNMARAIECYPDHLWNIFDVRWECRPIFKGYKEGDEYEIWSLNVSGGQYVRIHNFFTYLAESKAKYDYAAALGLFLKWKQDIPDRYFCSEGCIYPLVREFNWTHIHPWKVTPENFVQIIQAKGAKIVKKGIV